jgi:oxaloacetate decarboxylase gamma subunit
MEVNVIGEALKFMVLGMGVVFVFLYVMILAVKVQAYLIGKYFPDKPATAPAAAPAVQSDDEQTRVAAVIAAVTEFRKNKS